MRFFSPPVVLRLSIALLLLLLIGELPAWSLLLSALALVLSLAALRWPKLRPPGWLMSVAALGSGVLVWTSFESLIGREASASLLVVLASLKCLESRGRNEERTGALIGLFLVVVTFLFQFDLWITLAATFVALTCLWQLLGGAAGPDWRSGHWSLLLRMSALALPLTLLLFLTVPRLQHQGGWIKTPEGAGRTGFRDEVDPGSVASIEEDRSPVFRVMWEGEAPSPPLYWRGAVLSVVEAFAWKHQPEPLRSRPRNNNSSEEDDSATGREHDGNEAAPFSYSLILEPQTGPWTFAPEGTEQLRVPGGGVNLRSIQSSLAGVWFLSHVPERRLRLEGVVRPSASDVLSLNTAQLEWLTKTPELGPRAQAFLQKHLLGATTRTEKIRQLVLAFREEGFVYTRSPGRLGGLENFLEAKAGFCEHYASAVGILLRAAGIPARVVSGYLGGQQNPVGGFWQITQADAHAWVEALDEEGRWQRVDASAVVPPRNPLVDGLATGSTQSSLDNADLWDRLLWSYDAVNYQWVRFILEFDLESQKGLLKALGFDRWVSLLALTILTLLLLSGVVLLRGSALRFQKEPVEVRRYRRLLEKARRVGLDLPESLGPLDVRDRLQTKPDLWTPKTERVWSSYLRLRYGGLQPTNDV